jgi:S1-C subfamily serine protease
MFRKTIIALTHFALIVGLVPTSWAQQKLIRFSSGTGFFVSKDGHIITNDHVVRNCLAIEVDGAAKSQARIIATDAQKDLAIWQIPKASPMVAPLRWNLGTLRVGHKVSILGYPGESGARGELRYSTSQIIGLEGPTGEPQWVQIKPVLEKGNSGGPLLDSTGNVIGVVTGKTQVYRTNTATSTTPQLVKEADVAVTLGELKSFLDRAAVRYYQSSSGMVNYADTRLGEISRKFVVHVRCITSVE